jgi:uncharacterized damage-inducible protein DinB
MDNLRYPIGRFKQYENPDMHYMKALIVDIGNTPSLLRNSVYGLNEEQLDIPYRERGWTVRQVIHHIADNDMNAYFRFKRTLTEDGPIIPSYREDVWAELLDYKLPVEVSLSLIESIYARFIVLLQNLNDNDFKRTMNSLTFGKMSLEVAIQRFLWHDRHHMSQILSLRSREQW